MFTVSMTTAAILKIPRPDGTSWDGDPPSYEDRIISLWEFGRTSSRREEEEE